MDQRDVIRAQARAVGDDVYNARRLLNAFIPAPGPVHDMRAFFEKRLKTIDAAIADVVRGADDEAQAIGELWGSLGEQQDKARTVGTQILTYVEGGALRERMEDDSTIWTTADALLEELSRETHIAWQRFTIPGDREYIDTETQMIRLSCPGFTVWDLPIVEHEFGHYAGPLITITGTGTRALAALRETRAGRERAHLDEFFGDIFALHVGGPAYACNCVVMRFSPTADEAHEATDTHPSHNERVAMMLTALRGGQHAADPPDIDPDSAWLVDRLDETWRQSMMFAGKTTALADDRKAHIQTLLSRFIKDVLVHVSGYDRWNSVRAVAEKLNDDPRSPPRLAAGIELRDLLNVAWLSRMRQPAEVIALERFLTQSLGKVMTARAGSRVRRT